jgi:AcrR family transcriptional regulator
MGPETSASRMALLDGAEAVMLERGYAAVTARSVAERAGLKHQLVYYYFRTMDELLAAAFRRRMERLLARLEEALQAERPLHAFWEAASDPPNAALSMEYMALANHNEAVRVEIMVYGEQARDVVVARLSGRLSRALPDPEVLTPLAITMALTCIGHVLGFDSAMGISGGHAETRRLMEWCLDRLEPAARAATAKAS